MVVIMTGVGFEPGCMGVGEEAVHMVDSLVQFDPEKRLTVEEVCGTQVARSSPLLVIQAISDPFMEQLHDPNDEPVFESGPVDPQEFAFERRKVDRDMLRSGRTDWHIVVNMLLLLLELLKEVFWYHPHLGEAGLGPLRSSYDTPSTGEEVVLL